MRIMILMIGMASAMVAPAFAQSLVDRITDQFRSGANEIMRPSIETQSLPPIGDNRPNSLPPTRTLRIVPAPAGNAGLPAVHHSIATPQTPDIVLSDDAGGTIALLPLELYQALGDRLIRQGQVIGNNTLYWSQIDPDLPERRIEVITTGADPAAARAMLVGIVRQGCIDYGGTESQCRSVNLLEDGRLSDADNTRVAGSITPGSFRLRNGAAVVGTMAGAGTVTQSAIITDPAIIGGFFGPVSAPSPVMVEPAMVAPMIMERASPLTASRIFLGRSSYPPAEFAAYGILAFTTLPAPEDRERYIEICDAFFAAIISSSELEVPLSEQMVTVWPIDDRNDPGLTDVLNISRAETDSCAIAVDHYDILVADQAIRDARFAGKSLNGRGPFLIAWSPGDNKGFGQVAVLSADLTDVNSTADAKEVFRVWTDDIEKDTDLWATGFSLEKLRLKLRQIANRYGEGMSKYFGG